MLGRPGMLARAGLGAILLFNSYPAAALGQERPKQLSGLLIDEAGEQLKRQTCTGVGNARVMYAAAEVLVREYDELKESRQALGKAAKDAASAAHEKSCETSFTDLVPREGATVPVFRWTPAPGGGGKVKYGIPEQVLATLYMSPEKRTEYLKSISPETKAAMEAWQNANLEGYEDLSRAMQTESIDVSPTLWQPLKGYKVPTNTDTWILPKDGKLDLPSGATGLPK